MNAKNQLGASQLNPQIVPGPRLPENEVIIRREDEFAAHERFGITPHSTGISYDDLKILTDKILRDSHALLEKTMPAPKPALDPAIAPTINHPNPESTDEYQEDTMNTSLSNDAQSQPEVEIVARALAAIRI